jgi:hypothetical protein
MSKQKTQLQLVTQQAIELEENIERIKCALADSLANVEFLIGNDTPDIETIKTMSANNTALFEEFFGAMVTALELNTKAVTLQTLERVQYNPNNVVVYPGTHGALTRKPPTDPDIVSKHLVSMNTSGKFH